MKIKTKTTAGGLPSYPKGYNYYGSGFGGGSGGIDLNIPGIRPSGA